jgi:hypothetical protein
VKEAYDEAVQIFSDRLTKEESKRIWLRSNHSMQDVQAIVQDAKEKYVSSKQGKAGKWLTKLSSRIMLYSTLLDTFSQHHPEYVSLAWGAFKVVFVVGSTPYLVERTATMLTY